MAVEESFESGRMRQWLRLYLDPAYVAPEGPDQDKDFIREYARRIAEALPANLSVRPERPVKVLVITRGTLGAEHVPGAAGLLILLREAAQKYGALELTELYDDPPDAAPLSQWDVVVLNNVGATRSPDVYNRLLPEYVRNGGGLLAVHGSALLFRTEPDTEYNRMLGAYVDVVNARYGHPSNHGRPFPTRLPEPGHPLAAAFRSEPTALTAIHQWLDGQVRRSYQVSIRPPEQLADELYVLILTSGQESLPRVLLAVDPRRAEQRYPDGASEFTYALTWVKRYGKGRVYYTQLGHNMAVYSVPCIAQAILDGLLYAAGVLPADDAPSASQARITACE